MTPEKPHSGAQVIDLEEVDFTPELWSCIPAETALKFRILPVAQHGKHLVIALADPRNLKAIDSLHEALGRKFDVLDIRIADESQISFYLEEIYGE